MFAYICVFNLSIENFYSINTRTCFILVPFVYFSAFCFYNDAKDIIIYLFFLINIFLINKFLIINFCFNTKNVE